MTKQSIHDFTYEDKQAALDEANDFMNPQEKLNEIEKYATNALKRDVCPILKEDEFNLFDKERVDCK